MSTLLPFKISSNLKNIIGKELINDKYIAIFELVKNSYDANANNVIIEFIAGLNPKIIIRDDGIGMSYEDIVNKWLFVAYSEKKEVNIKKRGEDYRKKIKRQFAGAKGVGRFSCDRLGAKLEIFTSPQDSTQENVLRIDWSKFEEDDEKEFINIAVEYDSRVKSEKKSGTTLVISDLRETWDRNSMLILKKSLMKLVSPQENENSNDSFNIELIAKAEIENDEKTRKFNEAKGINDFSYSIVNGKVINNIFEKLEIKTTKIDVVIDEEGEIISTQLYDRGVFVFSYKEKNEKYTSLKNLSCKIYYMNRAAKMNFTRQMGIEPVNYGSIFVYKNSFRVYPYGEAGRDFFNIDRRKAQGYNRYFGTREIMGEIKIIGDNSYFYETTSRDGGFVRNNAVDQLELFFKDKVLRVLEKYVVEGIRWGDPEKQQYKKGMNEQGLMPYDVKDIIMRQFILINSRTSVIEAKINEELIARDPTAFKSEFDKQLTELKKIAEHSDGKALEIVESLRKEADKVRARQYEAEAEQAKTQEELEKAEKEVNTRKIQNEANAKKIDKSILNLEDGHHLIYKFASEVSLNLELLAEKFKQDKESMKLIEEVYCWNNRIKQLSNLAVRGDYDFKGRNPVDIISFLQNLINDHPMSKYINVTVCSNKKQIVSNFLPTDLSLIFDNLIDNSYKAGAKNLKITVAQDKDYIVFSFSDDGGGLSPEIKDVESIFEISYSKTGGTGLGLSHVKRVAQENGGDAIYIPKAKGFEIQVRIKYEYKFQNSMV